jgi:hypothetical protein
MSRLPPNFESNQPVNKFYQQDATSFDNVPQHFVHPRSSFNNVSQIKNIPQTQRVTIPIMDQNNNPINLNLNIKFNNDGTISAESANNPAFIPQKRSVVLQERILSPSAPVVNSKIPVKHPSHFPQSIAYLPHPHPYSNFQQAPIMRNHPQRMPNLNFDYE